MSVESVVSAGYGAWGSAALVVTRGYSIGSPPTDTVIIPAADIAALLEAYSLGTVGTDVFVNLMPEHTEVQSATACFDVPGDGPFLAHGMNPVTEMRLVQVQCRHADPEEASAMCTRMLGAFRARMNVTVGQHTYDMIVGVKPPALLGRDQNGLTTFYGEIQLTLNVNAPAYATVVPSVLAELTAATDIASLLQTAGLGAIETDLFINILPPQEAALLMTACFDIPSPPARTAHGMNLVNQRRLVQIQCRSANPQAAAEQCADAMSALTPRMNVTVGSNVWQMIVGVKPMALLGRDGNGLTTFYGEVAATLKLG